MPIIDRTRTVSATTDAADVDHPLLLWRNLLEDDDVVYRKLERLGLDPTGMHGDLQVIRSALIRMSTSVEKLIAIEHGERSK
jgi:hypothetical protein